MRTREARPDPVAILKRISAETRRRTLFRVHVGYARGVGATTNMLDEARRRSARGTDVVVAAYRVHGEAEQALRDLTVLHTRHRIPNQRPLDVAAVLVRNPEVVVIDDLAEVDSEGRPRLEAVARLLKAGITVLASLHVMSVKSVADAFGQMLGQAPPGPLIDDAALEAADELELADIPPAALLQRLREEHVLPPAELAIGLQRELRMTVLEALRERAFRLIAEHTDRQLVGYMRESGVEAPWEVRGRIVLALPVEQGLEERIRRAYKYAAAQDAKFSVVSVRTREQSAREKEWMGGYAAMAHQLGGEFVHLHGSSVARALVDYVRRSLATEVILGHRRRARWMPLDTTSEVIRLLTGVDVHILRAERPITTEKAPPRR